MAYNLQKGFARICCIVTDKAKPVLVKIFPRKLLKNVKAKIVNKAVAPENDTRSKYEPGAHPKGANLIGYLKAEMGIGQGGRLYAKALEQTGAPYALVNFESGNAARHGDSELEQEFSDRARYAANIIHINPEQMDLLHLMLPQSTWDKRYNIGVWLWELEDIPDEWCKYFPFVDEVWAPANFTAEAIRKKSPVPVTMIPYGIEAKTDPRFDRAYFGLPENRFLFLCMYDTNSTMARKNPRAVVKAFKQAFAKDDTSVGLVVKLNNPTDKDMAILKADLEGYENITFINRILSKTEVNSLIADCNVFVSLHRSEGFGLVMAEAMYLGIPSIATGWSANTDFMNRENSCLVDYSFIPVGENYHLAAPNQRWADPDIGQAAEYMKRLSADPDYYREVAENGKAFIREEYSLKQSAEKMKRRLSELDLI